MTFFWARARVCVCVCVCGCVSVSACFYFSICLTVSVYNTYNPTLTEPSEQVITCLKLGLYLQQWIGSLWEMMTSVFL